MIDPRENEYIDELLLRGLSSLHRDEDGKTIRGDFTLAPNLPVFQGHFPGNPLLPAIIQLAMVRLLAGKALERVLVPVATGRIKFKGFIAPADAIRIHMQLRAQESAWLCDFTIAGKTGTVAGGRIFYQEENCRHGV